jgi:alpha-methylacyl-CoA racemase
MTGPLAGVRVVVLAGMGPVPFTAMLLADMGARSCGWPGRLAGPPGP